MTWRNRPGAYLEQRFNELEKEIGLENLVDNPILTVFPVANNQQKTIISLVEDSGILYLVVTYGTKRARMALSSF